MIIKPGDPSWRRGYWSGRKGRPFVVPHRIADPAAWREGFTVARGLMAALRKTVARARTRERRVKHTGARRVG